MARQPGQQWLVTRGCALPRSYEPQVWVVSREPGLLPGVWAAELGSRANAGCRVILGRVWEAITRKGGDQ